MEEQVLALLGVVVEVDEEEGYCEDLRQVERGRLLEEVDGCVEYVKGDQRREDEPRMVNGLIEQVSERLDDVEHQDDLPVLCIIVLAFLEVENLVRQVGEENGVDDVGDEHHCLDGVNKLFWQELFSLILFMFAQQVQGDQEQEIDDGKYNFKQRELDGGIELNEQADEEHGVVHQVERNDELDLLCELFLDLLDVGIFDFV